MRAVSSKVEMSIRPKQETKLRDQSENLPRICKIVDARVICRILLPVTLCVLEGSLEWVLLDDISLESVLDAERDGLMSCTAPCKPGTGLTVGLGSGERLTSKNPVSGLWTLVTRPW